MAWKEWSPSIHYAQYQTLKPCRFAERRLYDFEIICVIKGALSTEMLGAVHVVTEGQLIFLPAGVPHRNEVLATESAAEATFLGIHFDFDGRLSAASESDIVVSDEGEANPDRFAREADAGGTPPLSNRVVYDCPAECLTWMDRIALEFTMRSEGCEAVCRGLMLNVLVALSRAGASRLGADASLHAERIRKLIARMEQAPAAAWPSERIARELKLNEDYAAKLFRQVAGMPPGRLLKAIRHREAKRLLRETDWSVEVIGERVGYPDLHYFSRIFSSGEGISPREYRKLSRML
ncbi:AraC family transcriptional regulator [Cohnella fermenti]|uniref:AraC family transcriptional regulator n=2 Tax=Cohnella fermenti TaxID=2565925 RepID=A0A4S4C6C9_9BACL|nr:AraC family transcriptional regulator [Cohnella fermenti]